MRINTFISKMHGLGVKASGSDIKDMIGNEVTESNVRFVIEHFWKDIEPNLTGRISIEGNTQSKIAHVAKFVLNVDPEPVHLQRKRKLSSIDTLNDLIRMGNNDLIIQAIMDEVPTYETVNEWYLLVSQFIRKFKGDGSDLIIEFAFFCTRLPLSSLYYHMSNFGIKSEQVRYEIAMEYMQQMLPSSSSELQNFQLSNQILLNNYAMELAKQCPFSLFQTNCIQVFGINDQKMLVQLAYECAKKDGNLTAENIKLFGTINEQDRCDILLECLKDKRCIKFLPKFEITSQVLQIKLAESLIQDAVLAQVFSHFNIIDEGKRIQLAIECAKQNTFNTAYNIKLFKITNQKGLIEIAKVCVKNQDGGSLPPNFKRLGIDDEHERIAIAQQCAQNHPCQTLNNIENFNIKDHAKLLEIVKSCLHEGVPYHYVFDVLGNSYQMRADIFFTFFARTNIPYNELKTSFDFSPMLPTINFNDLGELSFDGFDVESNKVSFAQIQNNLAREQTAYWLFNTLTLLTPILSDHQREWLNATQFLHHIQKIEDPKVRWRITECLYLFLMKDKLESFEPVVVKNLDKGKGKKLERGLYLIELICVYLKEKDLIKKHKKLFISDSVKLNHFLNVFSRLITDDKLKERLVAHIFDSPDLIIKRLQYLTTIFDLRESGILNQDGKIEDLLRLVLQSKFNNLIELDDQSVAKLQVMFETKRNPEAIFIYLSKLNLLSDVSITAACRDLVLSLLNDQFQELRYDSSKNKHLQLIDNDVLSKWKLNKQEEIGSANFGSAKINLFDWFYQKLITDNHYIGCAILEQYLKKYITMEQAFKSVGNDRISRLCLELIQGNEIVKEKLVELLSVVQPSEFSNDIRSLLHKSNDPIKGAIVVDTDDFTDLLLCGTDVLGSCQRVDGSPSNNKGLLGYLMNGQTRLLAVKTKAGPQGAIHARCLLRLLWDDVQKKPVVLRERFYPSTIPFQAKWALNKLASEKATELGLSLVSLEETDKVYPNPIKSVGGRAPYEYVDAVHGVQNGGYEVKRCWVVGK